MLRKLIILYHYFKAKKRMRASPQEVAAWQKKERRAIVCFAKKHSLFYKKHLGEVISKKDMIDHFSSYNTRGIEAARALSLAEKGEEDRTFESRIGDVTIGLSSGTSGNRGLFLVSDRERLAWCGNILAKVLPKAPWKKQKIAFFLRANSELYETVRSRMVDFRYFDLLADVGVLKRELEDFAPDILIAPPSMLLLLIGACRPQKVISVAETLLTSDADRLEVGFGQKIHQVYQCTEGFLAYTCEMGNWHLNEDLVFFEKDPVDQKRFCPIITDLSRKAQPMIRYRLDDVLVAKEGQCPCGCPYKMIERIEGRCDDVLTLKTVDGNERTLFPDFISRRILAASAHIVDFEVVQTAPDIWILFIPQPFQVEVERSLKNLFVKLKCLSPQLIFSNEPITRGAGRKKRQIRRDHRLLKQGAMVN